MAEVSGGTGDSGQSSDRGPDWWLRDPLARAWLDQHAQELATSVTSERLLYLSLAFAFVGGLAAHIAGYLLRAGTPAEPLALPADLLYSLGFALWTGVVVALFVQVIPETKRRQIRTALGAYEASGGASPSQQGPH